MNTNLNLEPFIQETLERWHVPGVAVAVVKEGEVIHCGGYGLRDRAHNLPVTPDTLFPIASCTKAFTAMCVGLLVDEGKLEWDKPLREYLPTFKLKDDFASSHMTPRDLLCHRSGLPRHDFVWYLSNFSRREVFSRLQYLEPNTDFRSSYYYQNMMFMVAGLLVGELTGTSWEEFVRQRIFEPLGMKRSNTSTAQMQRDPDHGRPYQCINGNVQEIPFYDNTEKDATGPAGSINSCVNDMARWLTIHIHSGKLGDTPFVSPNTLREMHKPHIFVDDPQERERFGKEFLSYGLGWFMNSHKGEMLIHHGGNLDGFSTQASFMPRHKVGVVVLTNGNGDYNAIPMVLSNTIYDRLLGLEPTDWNAKYQPFYDEMLAGRKASQKQSGEEKQSAPASHPVADYLGEYEHPGYGIYAVRQAGEALELVANDKIHMPLSHYHYDIFQAAIEHFEWYPKVSFQTDVKGNISGFSMQLEDTVKEIQFVRRADSRLSDPALLAQFTGDYEVLGLLLQISLRDGKLFGTLPGQKFELLPYRGTEFQLKEQPGVSITFKTDESGAYNLAQVSQPGETFTAKRK